MFFEKGGLVILFLILKKHSMWSLIMFVKGFHTEIAHSSFLTKSFKTLMISIDQKTLSTCYFQTLKLSYCTVNNVVKKIMFTIIPNRSFVM